MIADASSGPAVTGTRGLEALPELVRRSGTTCLFAMLGGTNAPWIAHGVEAGAFRLVRTRHEDTAMNGAVGYARSTGRVGICSVTRGPGYGNAVNALIAATKSHVPVVLEVAESPPTRTRTEQSIDQAGLTAAIGAGFHHVATAAELEERFWDAVVAAGRDGTPQVLSVADGVVEAPAPLSDDPTPPAPAPTGVTGDIAAAVDLLQAAERPLVLAGQGAVLSGGRAELEELAEIVGARVATSLRALSFFSGHRYNLGISGGWAAPAVREALASTDVVVAIGASFNTFTTDQGRLYQRAEVIHCDVHRSRATQASRPELALGGDAKAVALALIGEWKRRGLGSRPVRAPETDVEAVRSSVLDVDLGHDAGRGLDPRAVCAAVDRLLPEDRIVVSDLGRYQSVLPTIMRARDALSWIPGRGHGSIGLGLGTAIGATAAWPERPVVLICGDGGFMIALHDIDAARVNGLNLTVVVINDEQLGADVEAVRRYGLPLDVLRQPMPDVPMLAASVGGTGVVLRCDADLAALELPGSGFTVVDARVDREVNSRAVFA